MNSYKRLCPYFLLLAVLPLCGCLFRTHTLEKRVSTANLHEASLEQLINNVDTMASHLQSLKANVDIDFSKSQQKKGKANQFQVTDYPEISGYVLVRKPEMLRMIGLVPAVRNTLFDMVSNGKTFAVSVPPQNKFYIGANQVNQSPDPALETLPRPQAVFDALLLKEIDPQNEIAVLEQGTETVKDPKSHKDVEQSDYEVVVIRHEGDNKWYLSRKIIFSRVDLLPHRQLIYDAQGKGQVITDAIYEEFTNYGGLLFPAIVQIKRPIENYSFQIAITKLTPNQPLKDEQFVLNQPPGSKLINLDQKTANTTAQNGQPVEENTKPLH